MDRRTFDRIGAFLGWFAVLVQFVLMIQNRQAGVGETIVRFFSFFTILTNSLVAAYFTARGLGRRSWLAGTRVQWIGHGMVSSVLS